MKIAVFGRERRVGAVLNKRIVDLNAAGQFWSRSNALGLDIPAHLGAFIEGGDRVLDDAEVVLRYMGDAQPDLTDEQGRPLSSDLADEQLWPPMELNFRIFNIVANYADHLQQIRKNRGEGGTIEEVSGIIRKAGLRHFMTHSRNVIASGQSVRFPRRAKLLDFEAEIVAVIGPGGRDIAHDDATSHIWGYTMQNDWSIRGEPGELQHAKNFDTSSTLGPWIVVREKLAADNISFETRVNAALRQSSNTRNMVFSFADAIEFFSKDQTLWPGDMISGGTCAGTALDSSDRDADGNFKDELFLRPGDVIEISSPSIGQCTNRVCLPD